MATIDDITASIQNIWGSDYVQSNPRKAYKASYGSEYNAVAAYINGGARPDPANFSKLGKGLVQSEDARRSLVVTPPPTPPPTPIPPPPPPPTVDAYFDSNFAGGSITSPWSLVFSYTNPGYVNVPVSKSPDGRVSIVDDPAGGSAKVARMEIRDADAGWPPDTTLDKSEISSDVAHTWNKSAGQQEGDVRWFTIPLYLPYNATEKFEWAHGGSNPFTALIGLHPGSSTAWSGCGFRWYPATSWLSPTYTPNTFFSIFLDGGTWPSQTNGTYTNIFRLTDASAGRYMPNYNRWINLVLGCRFGSDGSVGNSSAWTEVWVDGANVLPRRIGPQMWSGDSQSYFKYGIYKQVASKFPETGRSVLYYGKTLISSSRPF